MPMTKDQLREFQLNRLERALEACSQLELLQWFEGLPESELIRIIFTEELIPVTRWDEIIQQAVDDGDLEVVIFDDNGDPITPRLCRGAKDAKEERQFYREAMSEGKGAA